MRTLQKLVIAAAMVALFAAQGQSQTIPEDEYREAVLVLFDEFLRMKQDGVFLDFETVELLGPDYEYSNSTRGDNPPGGWFGRPPGSDWLKRVDALRDTGHRFVCFDIPAMPSEVAICGHDLMSLYMAQGANDISFLDSVAARFWLARICHRSPDACAPFVAE